MIKHPESATEKCPLCGGNPIEYHRAGANTVTCDSCDFQVKQSEVGMGDAQERWNQLGRRQSARAEQAEAIKVAEKWLSMGATTGGHISYEDVTTMALALEATNAAVQACEQKNGTAEASR